MKTRWLAAGLAACMLFGNMQGAAGAVLQVQAAEVETVQETEEREPEVQDRFDFETESVREEKQRDEKGFRDVWEEETAGKDDPDKGNNGQSQPDDTSAGETQLEESADAGIEEGEKGQAESEAGEDADPESVKKSEEETEKAAEKEPEVESEKEPSDPSASKEPSGDRLIWKKEHAPLVQAGDLKAEHLIPDDGEKSGYSRKAAKNVSQKGSTLTKEQVLEGLRAKFAAAFSDYAHTVDISGFELYKKGYAQDGLDGEAIVNEAYQTAVGGEHFYITGDYKIGASESTGQMQKVSIGYGKHFRKSSSPEDGSLPEPDKTAIKAAVKEFHTAAAAAGKVVKAGDDDLEKILLLHDYLVTECTYDNGGSNASGYYPDDDYTAYGALVKRKAVCNGYAFAFSWLAKDLGIETYIVASESMDHAWNLVKLKGAWYHIDVTRDDPVFGKGITFFGLKNEDASDEGYVSHEYFLRSDGEMRSLGYTDWKVQASSVAIPAASVSSSFSEYLFRKYPDGAYGKISGKWYAGALAEKKIYRSSSLKRTDASAVYTDKGMLYAIPRGSLVYFCRTDGVFAYDPASGKILAAALVDGKEKQISEMGIRDAKLVYLSQDTAGRTERSEQALKGLYTLEAQGWLTLPDGSLKYFKKGKVRTGRQKISGSWYYLDKETGIRQTGWIKDGSYRYYFDEESGKALTGWQVIGKKAYYFKKSNGRAVTGKRKIGGRKYTFNSKGVLKKSSAAALTGQYFFNKKGKPARGWKTLGNKKYYFSKKTYRYLTGLVKIGKYRYYFSGKGVMKTGFRTIDGRKYYFKSNGRMDTGWIETKDGKLRYLKNEKPVKGLQEIYGKEFYFDSKGNLQTGLVKMGGKMYYFLPDGGRAKDKYITLENADGTRKLAYFASDGARVTGKKTVNGHTLYLLANDGKLSASEKRQAVTTMALSYLKTKQSSSAHHKLVDAYNASNSIYKRKYKVTYKDQWCATAVSAWGILSGMENLLLPECSCRYMVRNFQSIGRWQENDAYVPQIGDIVMYDWQDKGKGDNTGTPDHVGLVLKTYKNGGDTYFLVIEGNCRFNINTGNVITSAEQKAGKDVDGVTYFRGVGIRTMKVNARYIRGFCLPKY